MSNAFQEVSLESLVSFGTGKLNSNAAKADGEYPFFTCGQETLRTDTWSFDGEYVLLAGNNAAAIYPLKYFKGKFDAYQRTYTIQTVDPNLLLTRYLYYALRPKLELMKSISTGVTTKFLTLGLLNRIEIHLPPLPTQRKIAAILSAYDDLIENNNRRIRILEEMAQLIYKEWFVNFRFPGHENVKMADSQLGRIPNIWKVKSVGDFGRVITGKTPSKKKPEYYGDYMQFIKTPDMTGNIFIIKTKEYLSRKGADSQLKATLPADTLCTTCIGTPGIVSITSQASQTNQQINSVILHDTMNREFLYFCLLNLKDTIKGYGAVGATMSNLSKSKFEGLQVISPDMEIRKHFHNIVSPMFDAIKVFQKQNFNLHCTRDMLLPKLSSGDVDVSELDIETGGSIA